MSGSTGAERVRSREDFKKFVESYTRVISKFPGFKSLSPSGSYNSNVAKNEFGDVDLIVHISSTKDKADVKKELTEFFAKMSDDVVVPFSSPRYKGHKSLNTGEIVTIRYHDKALGYSVQIDNIVALTKLEADFKKAFLDFPAEKQGLILGLVKVAATDEPYHSTFDRLRIHETQDLPKDEEYEFNLSSVELQLRRIKYQTGTYKQLSREVIWASKDFSDVKRLLYKYDLTDTFEGLIKQAEVNLKTQRAKTRMAGVFKSMVSIKSGEVGTAKGANKQTAIDAVNKAFGESSLMTFGEYIAN